MSGDAKLTGLAELSDAELPLAREPGRGSCPPVMAAELNAPDQSPPPKLCLERVVLSWACGGGVI